MNKEVIQRIGDMQEKSRRDTLKETFRKNSYPATCREI
jgi:hypothetical protein